MSELPTAAQIKERAARAGLTITRLCKEAGVAVSILNRWEIGETSPTLRNVARLLDTLAKHEEPGKRT
jgi:predicted transcriptional regulator